MENLYKTKIIDFIEGRTDPQEFFSWFESNEDVFDWLQGLIPKDKTMRDLVEVDIYFFLEKLPLEMRKSINDAYTSLCEANLENQSDAIIHAKKVVDLLLGIDTRTVELPDILSLLLPNMKTVLENPHNYKSSYVEHMILSVKEIWIRKYDILLDIPYDVKRMYNTGTAPSKLWTYVNNQSWLYRLMSELFPDKTITKDTALHDKASFMMDVCPEYIEGTEIEENEIIENIISQVPEEIPKGKRIKQIKELIKKEFHIEGNKYPRWVQGGEWPVSKSGKPMRFVEQKRKKGKQYENMMYTVYTFEDVDTGEIRTVEQFT